MIPDIVDQIFTKIVDFLGVDQVPSDVDPADVKLFIVSLFIQYIN